MNLQSYLDEMGVPYLLSQHPSAFTAQDLAMAEHISGKRVIKPVIVRADGEFVMCALPACRRIDLGALKNQLQANELELADETALSELFPDCELGAEPPIGCLYGMTTLMDEALTRDEHVTFQAGTHAEAVTMSLMDYRRLAQPEVAYFGRPA